MAAAAAEKAEREAQAQAEAIETAHRRLLAEERVREKLLAGRRRFRGAQLDVVEEWAFDAGKELVRSDGDVGELEAAVLEAIGVDPGLHTTWPIHRGGCDGVGGESCDARIAELAAQRFEDQEASVAAAEALTNEQSVQFLDWGRRPRTGETLHTDGPLLQVRYRLASGQDRTAWIDVLRIEAGQ